MVIPIMLALLAGFIGLMIQVEIQQQLDTATKLAAESTFQAPRSLHDTGTKFPTRCRYASETFEGTMAFAFGDRRTLGAAAPFNGMSNFQDHSSSTNPFLDFHHVNICKVDPTVCNCGEPRHPDDSVVGGPVPFRIPAPGPPGTNGSGGNPWGDMECDIDFRDPKISQLRVTFCTSAVDIDYSKTPLAWAVFWKPTLTSTSEAVPPPFRQ